MKKLLSIWFMVLILFIACKRRAGVNENKDFKDRVIRYDILIKYDVRGNITHRFVSNRIGVSYTAVLNNKFCSYCETYLLKDGSIVVELEARGGLSDKQVLEKLGNYGEKNISIYDRIVEKENNNFEE